MKVHFLGVAGSGASAAAATAKAQGFEVSGCDLEIDNEFTKPLSGIPIQKGHKPDHLNGVQVLAVTPAIYSLDPNNPELLEAEKQGIEILTWQAFMGKYLMKDKFVIAVSGTHGKTTTTAMVAKILEDAGLDPTVVLGAIIPWTGTNFRVGHGKYFVIEADEYNDNFLSFKPDIVVVTNIEMDHPEYFKDFSAYKESFKKFANSAERVIADLSDPVVAEVLALHPKGVKLIIDYSEKLIDFPLIVPGHFNRQDASAAYLVGLLLNISPRVIRESLSNYEGVNRRFEYIGEYNGAKIYSDFGHHPTEIKTTMEAAREKFPGSRILLIYQPHMFTRTKYLFDDFVKVLSQIPVDKIFLMDIYQSREHDLGLVTSQQLVETIGKETVTYIGSPEKTLEKLKPEIRKGDIVFFMSAGDTDRLAKQLVNSKE